ncbi:MAG: crossover junction endodeoxyribonuclease RuvC [Flavobacteriales bacterium]|nr:crossover junction endodeoxyribonuclease RuvC [Flavobacteriales bacterium]
MDVILGIDPGSLHMGYAILKGQGGQWKTQAVGVLELNKITDIYQRLAHIFNTVERLIKSHQPTALAIEAPYYGKSVPSMLKLGRAQGVAIAAAVQSGIPVFEYAPRRIKQSVTGRGAAGKEQVQAMLRHLGLLPPQEKRLDASDALAVALCHGLNQGLLTSTKAVSRSPKKPKKQGSWADFVKNNPDRIQGK